MEGYSVSLAYCEAAEAALDYFERLNVYRNLGRVERALLEKLRSGISHTAGARKAAITKTLDAINPD